jgi:hypothetical protein
MSIDERLEKLVERHEALTLSVELIAIENRKLDTLVTKIAIENRKLDALVAEIAGGIRSLVTVARSHERRISNLEGLDNGSE